MDDPQTKVAKRSRAVPRDQTSKAPAGSATAVKAADAKTADAKAADAKAADAKAPAAAPKPARNRAVRVPASVETQATRAASGNGTAKATGGAAKAMPQRAKKLDAPKTRTAQPKPVETKPVELKAEAAMPAEPMPVESKPAEPKPAEPMPVESKPVEPKPAELTAEAPAVESIPNTLPIDLQPLDRSIEMPANGASNGASNGAGGANGIARPDAPAIPPPAAQRPPQPVAAAAPPEPEPARAQAGPAEPPVEETAEDRDGREPSGQEMPPPAGWPPRDMLMPFVLLAVSMQRAHGYVIEEYLRALGVFGFTMSTLYRMLRQMEKDGYLASSWEPGPTGPARRVYTLTDAGRMWLDASAAWLDIYRGTIDRFFGLYTGSAPWPGARSNTKEETR